MYFTFCRAIKQLRALIEFIHSNMPLEGTLSFYHYSKKQVKKQVNKRENMKKRNSITEVGKSRFLKLQADPKKSKNKRTKSQKRTKTLKRDKTKHAKKTSNGNNSPPTHTPLTRLSTSASVGRAGIAPFLVVVIAPHAFANFRTSLNLGSS